MIRVSSPGPAPLLSGGETEARRWVHTEANLTPRSRVPGPKRPGQVRAGRALSSVTGTRGRRWPAGAEGAAVLLALPSPAAGGPVPSARERPSPPPHGPCGQNRATIPIREALGAAGHPSAGKCNAFHSRLVTRAAGRLRLPNGSADTVNWLMDDKRFHPAPASRNVNPGGNAGPPSPGLRGVGRAGAPATNEVGVGVRGDRRVGPSAYARVLGPHPAAESSGHCTVSTRNLIST